MIRSAQNARICCRMCGVSVECVALGCLILRYMLVLVLAVLSYLAWWAGLSRKPFGFPLDVLQKLGGMAWHQHLVGQQLSSNPGCYTKPSEHATCCATPLLSEA
jgi:hypothetical protein